jgi:hypothetical protein
MVFGVIQHLFAIPIAFALNQIYQKRNLGCALVQIILQDPMYVEKDKMLLDHVCPNYPIQIVNDPDALFASGKNTLVIAPFLKNLRHFQGQCWTSGIPVR